MHKWILEVSCDLVLPLLFWNRLFRKNCILETHQNGTTRKLRNKNCSKSLKCLRISGDAQDLCLPLIENYHPHDLFWYILTMWKAFTSWLWSTHFVWCPFWFLSSSKKNCLLLCQHWRERKRDGEEKKPINIHVFLECKNVWQFKLSMKVTIVTTRGYVLFEDWANHISNMYELCVFIKTKRTGSFHYW